mgnify:CR=1 FL=1
MSARSFDFAGRNSHETNSAGGGRVPQADSLPEPPVDAGDGPRHAVAFYVPGTLAHDFKVRLARSEAPDGGRLTATDVLAALISAWVSGDLAMDGTRDAQPRGDRTRLTAYLDDGLARRLREACAESDVSGSEVARRLVAAWVSDPTIIEVP